MKKFKRASSTYVVLAAYQLVSDNAGLALALVYRIISLMIFCVIADHVVRIWDLVYLLKMGLMDMLLVNLQAPALKLLECTASGKLMFGTQGANKYSTCWESCRARAQPQIFAFCVV